MRKLLRRTDIGIIIGCIFLFVLFSLWNPQQWFSWSNISNIGQYTAILGLLAIGQTFVILIREIDLSVGSVYGIVGITFAGLENNNVSVLGSFILAMLLALLIGLANAILVIRGNLSSMIVTLGGLFFYRGLVYVTTRGAVTRSVPGRQENWLARHRRPLAADRE
jgi:simple sugar transport system permease protein/ribose transport system permease protein